MRQAIRALGWTVNIFWILIIAFSVTAVYSAMNLGIGFGEAQMLSSSKGFVFSLPFLINNNGYYDISELNITTRVSDCNGTSITSSSTFVPLVSRGSIVETTHNISISLDDIMSGEFTYLLFNDSSFDLGTFVALNFAHAIPIKISTNATISWGAPFYNFSVLEISTHPHNATSNKVVISINFENHAFLGITGVVRLEIFNNINELVACGTTSPDVPSGHRYDEQIVTYLDLVDLPRLTESGKVRVIFETPMFVLEWWTPYG